MQKEVEADYLIVGQGIAGTILGVTLIKGGKSIFVIDQEQTFTSSKIAAGIYNPVVFRRVVKSWNSDALTPFAKVFYGQMENFLESKFHKDKTITRIFATEQQKTEWNDKLNNPEYQAYLKTSSEILPQEINKNAPFGTGSVEGSGQVNTNELIESFKSFLEERDMFSNETFNFNNLDIQEDYVLYENKRYSKVIFCEGYQGYKNPYFDWLPFSLTKGEVITLEIKNINLNTIISKGVFLMPMGNDLYKLGSTFNWRDPNFEPSEQGKKELLDKFSKFYNGPYKVISHEAAIRPTVKDRKPLIGLHPLYPTIGIFNGLGSKGLMLSPYYANQFLEFLNKTTILDKEVNILRYYNK